MDKDTIKELIKTIKEKRKIIKIHLKDIPQYNQDEHQYWNGMLDGLQDINDHLKSIIK